MKFKKILLSALVLTMALAILAGCGSKPTDDTKDSTAADTGSTVGTAAVTDKAAQTDQQLKALYDSIDDSGYQAGIAYIGFVGAETTESEMRIYLKSSPYAERYAFLCDAPIVDAGGTELYAVVTTRADRSASVYPADMTESGKYNVHTDKALYEGKGNDCFLLRCNISELHSNVSILFRTGDESFSVSPILSGATGQIDAVGCYDFSIYGGESGVQDDVSIAYGILLEYDEVKDRVDSGMSLQYTGETEVIEGRPCMVFALGTNRDDQFVRESYYAVCDNLVYSYDAVGDAWSILGAG